MEIIVRLEYVRNGLGGGKSWTFRDERKAQDFYTDLLLRYPGYEITKEIRYGR